MTIRAGDEWRLTYRIEGSEPLHNGDTLEIVNLAIEGKRVVVTLRKAAHQPDEPGVIRDRNPTRRGI